jgi:hypothetical protein
MSVWPATVAANPPLTGSDGVLVSVSIGVAPRLLEPLLEALAQLDFPVSPQIYHDAAMVYVYDDGRELTEAVTLVEFPAYDGQLDRLRGALEAHGFDPACMAATGMLEELHAEDRLEPAPAGAPYRARRRRKRAGLVRGAVLQ